MQLKSVTAPKNAGQEAGSIPTKEVLLRASSAARPSSKDARKRLVHGKGDRLPVSPRGGFTIESIIGADERTRIRETDEAPWRMVCGLEIASPGGNFIGTGWFAGPRTLITAGHCVYDKGQMDGWATSIVISPGRDGSEQPFGPVTSTRFATVNRWLEDQDADFDVAAIHLDDPLGDELGWFGVASLPEDELLDSFVNVSGYPGDKGGTQQWWARNRIRAVTPRRIFYDVDTFGGQSGGPAYILREEAGDPIVVGIHAYGVGGTPASIKLEVNSAPRIIPEVAEQVEAWIRESNSG